MDDLTLAGRTKEIQTQFWDRLKTEVKKDPPEFIDEKGTKILGRIHKIKHGPEQNVLTYDMRAYAKGIVDFFCEMTGTVKEKLCSVTTPCLPKSNMTDEELAKVGELSSISFRIPMRCVWLSRLAGPDIAFAVQRLASRVTKWTRWEDRQTHCLISYLHATSEHVMKLTVDPNQPPSLCVFTDSDFASCPYTAKSTSGIVCPSLRCVEFSCHVAKQEAELNSSEHNRSRVNCMRQCIVWGNFELALSDRSPS